MKFSSKKIFAVIFVVMLVVTCGYFWQSNNKNSKDYINKILAKSDYSYLSANTKEYIKRVYEKTGEIILTEKNKKDNTPYLNPDYDNYLSLTDTEKEKVDLVPDIYVIDYSAIDSTDSTTYPSKYNLSNVDNKNYLTPINNQGKSGLCWVFASVEQAESYLMVKNNENYSETSQRFSIRQLDYATSTDGINNYENENGFRLLTSGGNFYMSSLIMSYGLSLTDYTEFNELTDKKELADVLNFKNSNYVLKESIVVPQITKDTSEESKQSYTNLVKENIIKNGGAYVATGSPQGNCGFKNIDGTYALVDADNCVGNSGHAMQIIGWDDDYEYSYCSSGSEHLSVNDSGSCTTGTLTKGKGAWILRNSWGENSAYKFVYMGYNSYGYGIDFISSLSSMSDRSWDNVYHKNIWKDDSINTINDTVVFDKKINTDEQIKEVKFSVANSSGKYKITVESGNNVYKDIKTVDVKYPGIYTVDLSDKNILLNDSQFKVTVNGVGDSYVLSNTISVFTSNIESVPVIKTGNIDNNTLNVNNKDSYEFLVYSHTKNIDSNEFVTYSLYKDGNDYSNYITSYSNNKVAENNVNTTLLLDRNTPVGDYKLKVNYGSYESETNLTVPLIYDLKGSGTAEDPYQIYSEDDLEQMRYNLDAYYLLKSDINLTKNWVPVGTNTNPFRGALDGGNHTITGLKIESNGDDPVGLFGYVDVKFNYTIYKPTGYVTYNDVTYVKNLKISNAQVSNKGNAGILVGQLIYDTNDPDIYNPGDPHFTIENVRLIDGTVSSSDGDAGVMIANINNVARGSVTPYLDVNNMYSSVTISGRHSAGLIGYINDYYISGDWIKLDVTMNNFQNVGVIDVDSLNASYDDKNNYSMVIGGVYGNAGITLSNYIINSIYNAKPYMSEFEYYLKDKNYKYFIGYYDKSISNNLKYSVSNGYYINDVNKKEITSSRNIKDKDIYKSWENFDDYWKIETIDNIVRIPVLKDIEYNYTDIPDININRYDKVSLLDCIKGESDLSYIRYSVVSNDNIVDIDYTKPIGIYNTDIEIEALNKGTAIIHVVNNYDGFEKDVKINVTADKVDNPTITYYYNTSKNNESYTQQVEALKTFDLDKIKFKRPGYTFKGWNTVANGSGTIYKDGATIESGIDENIRLYAVWEHNKYTLKFNANGGTGTMNDEKDFYAYENSIVKIPTNKYIKDGYRFVGWNTKADGTGMYFTDNGEITFEQLTSIDGVVMTLYAQWEKVITDITFDANGGTVSTDSMKIPDDGYYGELPVPYKENAGFVNWACKSDGTMVSYSDEVSCTELVAVWVDNAYTFILDANGGTLSALFDNSGSYLRINSRELLSSFFLNNNKYTIDKNMFVRNDKTFKEWNTKADGSGKTYFEGELIGKDDVVLENNTFKLYAIWEDYFDYRIKDYYVDETNHYISKIMAGTSGEDFKKKIEHSERYGVEVDTKNIDGKEVMYTGGKTRIYQGGNVYVTYTNIVIGDVNGDGAINSADLLRIRQHLLGSKYLRGENFLASDINYDSDINSADILRVRQHLLGTKTIS